jgi:hypothetical protein
VTKLLEPYCTWANMGMVVTCSGCVPSAYPHWFSTGGIHGQTWKCWQLVPTAPSVHINTGFQLEEYMGNMEMLATCSHSTLGAYANFCLQLGEYMGKHGNARNLFWLCTQCISTLVFNWGNTWANMGMLATCSGCVHSAYPHCFSAGGVQGKTWEW